MSEQQEAIEGLTGATCSSFKVGQEVSWRYVPRGGWGIPIFVPARVLKVNPKTIRIAAMRKDGQWEERSVRPENLRRLKTNE